MDAILDWLPVENEFFVGGLVLGAMAAAWQSLKGIPSRVWPFIRRRFIFTVTIDSAFTEASLATLGVWLADNGYRAKVGQVYYDQWSDTFAPGNLTVWINYNGHRFLLQHDHGGEATQNGTKTRRTVSITGLRASRDTIIAFVSEVRETPREKLLGKTKVRTCGMSSETDSWVASRKTATICLPSNQMNELLDDVKTFRSSRERYQDIGIPYHRAWLLQGPPGTGKTSVVQAIATELQCGITVISSFSNFSSSKFIRALNESVSLGDIVLIEDVDATGSDAMKQDAQHDGPVSVFDDAGMSLADMLNALDGISTPCGLMLFMTTNHPERINDRLKRPGRVDYVMDFEHLTSESAREMSLRFFPGDDARAEASSELARQSPTTPAELQSHLNRDLMVDDECDRVMSQLEPVLSSHTSMDSQYTETICRKVERTESLTIADCYSGQTVPDDLIDDLITQSFLAGVQWRQDEIRRVAKEDLGIDLKRRLI